jgi:hypothetical protein
MKATRTEAQGFKRNVIPKWIDAEIDCALNKYFRNKNVLCSTYWSRSFRDMVAAVIAKLFPADQQNRPDCPPFSIQEKNQLTSLREKLVGPTSTYLNKSDRMLVEKVLGIIRIQKSGGLKSTISPPSYRDESNTRPGFINDYYTFILIWKVVIRKFSLFVLRSLLVKLRELRFC